MKKIGILIALAAIAIACALIFRPDTRAYEGSDYSLIYPSSYSAESSTFVKEGGARVQVQKRREDGPVFDLSTREGAAAYVTALNKMEEKLERGLILPESRGYVSYKQALSSPEGEAFTAYYAFIGDAHEFYVILVWNEGNDPQAVENMLSSFKPNR